MKSSAYRDKSDKCLYHTQWNTTPPTPLKKNVGLMLISGVFFLTGYMPYANKTFEFKEDPDIRPKEY